VKIAAKGLSAAIVVVGLTCSAVAAQELELHSAASSLDGFYAGIMAGPMSARMGNFFADPEDFYYQFGGVAGWNTFVGPGVIVGGEVQANVNTDFVGATNFDAMLIGRAGFLTSNDFMTYLLAGAGYFVNAPAVEVGLGIEWQATDKLSLRLEGVGIGQLGDISTGVTTPGISAFRITTGAVWHFGPHAASGVVVAATDGTSFSGPHVGLYAGGLVNEAYDFFVDQGNGLHLSRFAMGGMAGYDVALAPALRLGGEIQGGVNFDTSGDVGVDGLALARVGLVPLDGLMLYGAAGLGVLERQGAFAVGGGVEYALWGQNSVRAEYLSIGALSGSSTAPTFSSSKFTVGTVWRFE
jgi:hypothetical protein